MIWSELEKSFLNAWVQSLSKAKVIFCFISLILCGIFPLFLRTLAHGSSSWPTIASSFLSILLSTGLLLSTGIILIRIHLREKKGLSLNSKKVLAASAETVIETSYLTLPPVVAFLCLWLALGLFILLKKIPLIGPFFSVLLAFGPFLLIFCSLLLCLLSLAMLFFAVPAIALGSLQRRELWLDSWTMLQQRPFQAASLFLLSILPAALMGGLLFLAGAITQANFALPEPSSTHALKMCFMMIPICACMTLPVIFFFNFAADSYRLLRR